MSPNDACPCFSGKKYKRCCRPLHTGAAPEGPVLLMRSRYSAYALGITDYIIETTHSNSTQYSSDTVQWRDSIGRFCKEHDFVGLTIEESEADSDAGYVQFTANLKQGSKDRSFSECSIFRKNEAGRWKYLEAAS